MLGDRSEVVTHEDIFPGKKRLKIYTERIEPTGQILLLGYDDYGNWIRTQSTGGQWQDGEYLDLANAPTMTINYFSSVIGVQFTTNPRNGNVYLYEVCPLGIERQIATYEYNIPIPVFRRSVLANIPNYGVPSPEQPGSQQPWNGHCVTALVKTRWVDVQCDTDYPQISNMGAMKAMLQYIYKRDNDKVQDGEAYRQLAITIMNAELKQYNGYASIKNINFMPKALVGSNGNLF